MTLIYSVPPIDGLVLTPGLSSFIQPEYVAGVSRVLLDVGKGVAEGGGGVRDAYRLYNSLVNVLRAYGAVGGLAILTIPDAWDLKTHLRLATQWLHSSERVGIAKALAGLGFEVLDMLVVRRVVKTMLDPTPDLGPYASIAREFGVQVFGVPANVDTSIEGVDIKCRYDVVGCTSRARLLARGLRGLGAVHLMGPPIQVLRDLWGEVDSADTTGHTYGMVLNGRRINELTALLRLRQRILTVNLLTQR